MSARPLTQAPPNRETEGSIPATTIPLFLVTYNQCTSTHCTSKWSFSCANWGFHVLQTETCTAWREEHWVLRWLKETFRSWTVFRERQIWFCLFLSLFWISRKVWVIAPSWTHVEKLVLDFANIISDEFCNLGISLLPPSSLLPLSSLPSPLPTLTLFSAPLSFSSTTLTLFADSFFDSFGLFRMFFSIYATKIIHFEALSTKIQFSGKHSSSLSP